MAASTLGSRRQALSKAFYRFHRGPLCSLSSFSYDEIEFERFLPTTPWIWMPWHPVGLAVPEIGKSKALSMK